MTSAKLYYRCLAPNAENNVQYDLIQNFLTEAKCYSLVPDNVDVSNIVIGGAVLKLDTKVVGTDADCYESQCYTYVEACIKDKVCTTVLRSAEEDTAESANFLSALRENMGAGSANQAYTNLLTCVGLHSPNCESDLDVPTTPSPPSAAPVVAPTVAAISPTPAPTVSFTSPPTLAPTSPDDDAAAATNDDDTLALSLTPTSPPTLAPTSQPGRLLQPTPLPIQPVVSSRERYIASRSGESSMLWQSRRRLLAGGSTTVLVQVSSSGNQGTIGTATAGASPTAAGQFTVGSQQAATNAASAGGVGVAGTALIAIGCGGALIALVAGLAYQRKQGADERAREVTQRAGSIQAVDDQVDVL